MAMRLKNKKHETGSYLFYSFYPDEAAKTQRAPRALKDQNGRDICRRRGGRGEEESVLDLFSP